MIWLFILVYFLLGCAWVVANPTIEEAIQKTKDIHPATGWFVRIVFRFIWPYFFTVQIFEAVSKLSE